MLTGYLNRVTSIPSRPSVHARCGDSRAAHSGDDLVDEVSSYLAVVVVVNERRDVIQEALPRMGVDAGDERVGLEPPDVRLGRVVLCDLEAVPLYNCELGQLVEPGIDDRGVCGCCWFEERVVAQTPLQVVALTVAGRPGVPPWTWWACTTTRVPAGLRARRRLGEAHRQVDPVHGAGGDDCVERVDW